MGNCDQRVHCSACVEASSPRLSIWVYTYLPLIARGARDCVSVWRGIALCEAPVIDTISNSLLPPNPLSQYIVLHLGNCHGVSYLALSCRVLSYLVLSCLNLPYLILSCLTLPHLTLSYLILSCLVVSCQVGHVMHAVTCVCKMACLAVSRQRGDVKHMYLTSPFSETATECSPPHAICLILRCERRSMRQKSAWNGWPLSF